jgi:hypothetical protein
MENAKSRLLLTAPSLLGLGLLAHHLNPPPPANDARPELFAPRSNAPSNAIDEQSAQAQRDSAFDPGPALDRMLLSVPTELEGKPRTNPGGTLTATTPASETTAPPPAPPRPQAPAQTKTDELPIGPPPGLPLTAFPGMGRPTGPPPGNATQPRLTGFQFSSMESGGSGGASYSSEETPATARGGSRMPQGHPNRGSQSGGRHHGRRR